MVDVLMVSLTVVLMKFDAVSFKMSIESGLYIYAGSTLCSIIASNLAGIYVHRESII
ncbi:MAG: hypothetical protein CMH49_02155 [Myxococcales bacterium]|nr:hypothetical protein [Myxococcales bacterium]